jgi:hypothetical protein
VCKGSAQLASGALGWRKLHLQVGVPCPGLEKVKGSFVAVGPPWMVAPSCYTTRLCAGGPCSGRVHGKELRAELILPDLRATEDRVLKGHGEALVVGLKDLPARSVALMPRLREATDLSSFLLETLWDHTVEEARRGKRPLPWMLIT